MMNLSEKQAAKQNDAEGNLRNDLLIISTSLTTNSEPNIVVLVNYIRTKAGNILI